MAVVIAIDRLLDAPNYVASKLPKMNCLGLAYRVRQKKVPTLKNSWYHAYSTNLNDLDSRQKPNDRSIFVIFLVITRSIGKFKGPVIINGGGWGGRYF